ncbi:MAG: thioredoxin-dependent thiol peroxidase [Lentisphaeraceae bacterium]|nr:thioredoxin-dependent thiol peroxidase [Lentisphaeraceae bacterium]
MAISEGSKAPSFTLPDQDGKEHSLSDYKGKYVIVYFYPRDSTPGCTKEACTFRDNIKAFTDKDCVIFGVSKDSAKSHTNFIAKYDLPFTLLTDADGTMMEEYDAWGEKNNYGKKYMGIIRSTVLIGPDAKVIKHWATVRKAETHPMDVLEVLNEQ